MGLVFESPKPLICEHCLGNEKHSSMQKQPAVYINPITPNYAPASPSFFFLSSSPK